MSMKTIVLPDREEMLRRLVAVNDTSHLQQKFYPILLKDAGQRRAAPGVVMMFTLAISDYVVGMPPSMESMMFILVPGFIDALIDDKEVAEEAKAFLKEALKG